MASRGSESKPTVGIFFAGLHMDYTRELIIDLNEQLTREGMRVRWFLSGEGVHFFENGMIFDQGLDVQFLSVFGYSRFVRVDALVISVGTIAVNQSGMTMDVGEFLDCFPNVPKILLGTRREFPGSVCIWEDRFSGAYECAKYLIREQGHHRLGFFGGPEGITDFDDVVSGIRQACEDCGLLLDESLVVHGDFTADEVKRMRQILALHSGPLAIICGSGAHTRKMYELSRELGLRIGRDIAICGTDDIVATQYMNPPLSTIHLNRKGLLKRVAEMVRAACNSPQELASVSVRSYYIPNISDGTQLELTISKEEKLFHQRLIEDLIKETNDLKAHNTSSSLFMRSFLRKHINKKEFFEQMGEELRLLGAKKSFLGLLKEPHTVEQGEKMYVPKELHLYLCQNGNEIRAFGDEDAPCVQRDSFPMINGEPVRADELCVFALFYRHAHYGVFCVESDFRDVTYFYGISQQIGTALRYLYLALEQQEMHQKLQELNGALDYSANHDILTGLFNRAGLMKEMAEFLERQDVGSRFVAVIGDLDHLKQINDTFGHSAGDAAITAAADILLEALPKGSPVGRVGGDEFMAVFRTGGEASEEEFRRRVRALCEEYNHMQGKQYYIGVSVGTAEFGYENRELLIQYIRQADRMLYEAKKKRRLSVIKERF